jgi:hypothetical protein
MPWSSDGDLNIFLLHNRQFNDIVPILPSASSARLRPTLRKPRFRHPLWVGNTIDVLAATFTVHPSDTQRLPPALPPLLRCHFLFFITPAQMHIPNGRWHSNFVWHPGSECRTQPTVISNPFRAMLFICYTPAQRLGFSRTAPYQWCLSPMDSPADAAYRRRHPDPARLSFSPASLASPSFYGSTQSCSASCLQRHILLLLSRHPPFHGCSQSLHIACPNHPTASGT